MRRWSEDEDNTLKENAKALAVKQIANLLGRTPKAVGARANLIGVNLKKSGDAYHGRKYPSADIELARRLHESGMKLRLIAEKLEIPFTSLKNYFY